MTKYKVSWTAVARFSLMTEAESRDEARIAIYDPFKKDDKVLEKWWDAEVFNVEIIKEDKTNDAHV